MAERDLPTVVYPVLLSKLVVPVCVPLLVRQHEQVPFVCSCLGAVFLWLMCFKGSQS